MVKIYQNSGLLYLNDTPFKPSDVAIEFVTNQRNLIVRNSYNRTDILIDPTEITKVFKEDGLTAYTSMAEIITALPLAFANYTTTTKDLPLTAFGDLRTAELSPVLQISFEYTVTNTEIGTIEVLNSGTVTQADAMVVVSTGTTTGSNAEWETRRHAKYRAGLGGVMRFTTLFTQGIAGTEQIVGLADVEGVTASHKNGYAVGFSGEDFGFFRWQNDVLFFVPLTSWNDPLDGTGASGMTIDPTKLNVFFIQFQYLGAGAVKIWVEDDLTGGMILAHTLLYANLNITPSVFNPNFHMMVRVDNGATTSNMIAKSASMAYFIEGKTEYTELQQPQTGTGQKTKTSITAERAILTVRNKSTYASKVNFLDVLLENITSSIEAGSANNLGAVRLVRNATLGGTPSWSDLDTNNSLLEIDTSGTTVTGGKELFSSPLAGKNDRFGVNATDYKIILAVGDTITLAGKSSNSATITGSMLFKELF